MVLYNDREFHNLILRNGASASPTKPKSGSIFGRLGRKAKKSVVSPIPEDLPDSKSRKRAMTPDNPKSRFSKVVNNQCDSPRIPVVVNVLDDKKKKGNCGIF